MGPVIFSVGSNTPSPVVTPGNGSSPASFLFPWILSSLKVHAFDLFKVVDSFVKAEPRLTSDVVKVSDRGLVKVVEGLDGE